ncbi:MAG: glucose/mannose transport system substrate-binding protein [Paracoccaceae bacterium]|jgi:glucose/mannose transport system substrate-binding protein
MGQQNWQSSGALGVLGVAIGGVDWFKQVNMDRNLDVVNSDVSKAIWQAFADTCEFSDGSNVSDWNQATNLVLTGKAGGQIMGVRRISGGRTSWGQRLYLSAGFGRERSDLD